MILSSHLLSEVQEIYDRVAVIDHGRIIIEGTVGELRGAADLEILAEPAERAERAERAEQVLRGLAAVNAVRRSEPDVLTVTVPDTETAAVNRALVTAGVEVRGLRRIERQLEDVILDLTDPTNGPADG